jgi:hypothetical protein
MSPDPSASEPDPSRVSPWVPRGGYGGARGTLKKRFHRVILGLYLIIFLKAAIVGLLFAPVIFFLMLIEGTGSYWSVVLMGTPMVILVIGLWQLLRLNDGWNAAVGRTLLWFYAGAGLFSVYILTGGRDGGDLLVPRFTAQAAGVVLLWFPVLLVIGTRPVRGPD